jgi:23S rRNA (uracil1939-C5)-methyltransferase
MEKSVINALIKLNPRKIVYMSCNPETCVRDVKYLTSNSNYKLIEVKPFNMFPYTKHIEILACLQGQE